MKRKDSDLILLSNRPEYQAVTGSNATAVPVSRDTRELLKEARDYVHKNCSQGHAKLSINDIIRMLISILVPPETLAAVLKEIEDHNDKYYAAQCLSLATFMYNKYSDK